MHCQASSADLSAGYSHSSVSLEGDSHDLFRRISCYLEDRAYLRNFGVLRVTDANGVTAYAAASDMCTGRPGYGVMLRRNQLACFLPKAFGHATEDAAERFAGKVVQGIVQTLHQAFSGEEMIQTISGEKPSGLSSSLFVLMRFSGDERWERIRT